MQRLLNAGERSNQVPELKINGITSNSANDKFFEIMLVRNDEEQSVEVIESTVLDFGRVIDQLEQGNSIFITPKTTSKSRPAKKNPFKRDITYFNHI
jgi:hypothetical protein